MTLLRQKRCAGLVAAALTLWLGASASPARADVVSDWNATAQGIIAGKSLQGGVYYAMLQIPVYDAVNAIDGKHSVFAVRPVSSAVGASQEAAAAAAAYYTLLGLFPDQQVLLDNALAVSLAAIPASASKDRGVAIGSEVATAWLALRTGDGREAVVPYLYGTAIGDYQRTPPAFANALTPWLAKMKPFTLISPSQFRAYGPPDLTSKRFADDFNAVKSLGGATSTERTPDESEIALFYTENPTTYWGRNIRDFAATKKLNVATSARLFAQVFAGFADASIACWDSKFYYSFWRPVTAITNADADGNPATTADPGWTSFVVTPPHPEYPAAHACVTAGIAESLRDFFGTRYLKIRFTSAVANTLPHQFWSTDQMIDEVSAARVFGGMHYPTSTAHGARIGRQVAAWIDAGYFRRINH